MPSLTLDLSEQLQDKVKPFSRWLPVILEISLLNLKSPAHQTAGDFIDFLTSNPSEQMVGTYQLSEVAQGRVEQLLGKNCLGTLSEAETKELDDYFRLEAHFDDGMPLLYWDICQICLNEFRQLGLPANNRLQGDDGFLDRWQEILEQRGLMQSVVCGKCLSENLAM